ncbi:F390 synthetase-related protein [Runella slithyformis]|uniref:Adenylate-forming enzyme n=1 Tax=Runella slithyformis (strain ATCC 29530 / DSM 19594 / LMG 11500 / NCIMB 11436 / LSU 4) TaxID=761193 RepID=A0A7U3ZI80_RUNSL|nr:F390 synthetase-related protein [Runella slithyformis]AEI47702.1 adenylate-forming enzyme [Runella slithyformis DSM 19594]
MFFKLQILYFLLKNKLRGTFRERGQLVRFQEKAWTRFARTVLPTSAFYRSYAHLPLREFPLIHKEVFMQHFDEINTVGIPRTQAMQTALQAEESRDFASEINGITVGLSTGTSGKRGLFLASQTERAQWVAMVLHRVVKWSVFRRQKVAFFLRANSNLYSSVQSSVLAFHFFDIFRKTEELVAELGYLQPDIVAAQPSLLRHLAEAQRAGNLSITPQQIISFAEVLHDDDRRIVEQTFGIPITEVYQCTEGFLGVSCAYGTLHLNEDVAVFEKKYVGDHRFIPIVTDFTRTSQPIIRYEMTDILTERTVPCPCGSVLLGIERIEGRTDDVLSFEREGKIISVFPDTLVRKIARVTDDFSRYCIRQMAENQLEIVLEVPPEHTYKVRRLIQTAVLEVLKEQGADDVSVLFKEEELTSKGAKHRRVVRMPQKTL